MRVFKTFRWEAAHRIPWHEGACRHLHGHSYVLTVGLEGPPDARGMVMDFQHLKALLKGLVDRMDHAVLVSEGDAPLLDAMTALGNRVCVLPYDTTSENLCRFVADALGEGAYPALVAHGVTCLLVRLQETETCWAELSVPVSAYAPAGDGAAGLGAEGRGEAEVRG